MYGVSPKPRRRSRPVPRSRAALPTYRGRFGRAQAERLLWRAGFGPRRGEAERFAALGLEGAVHALTHPRSSRLSGPAPRVDGRGLAPRDVWGHDVLWWLDRMVRTEAPLVERMTLVWHDWFATSRASVDARWMLRQNALLRRRALGDFGGLVRDITRDPAMLIWLDGISNDRWSPNENYARELQELFTLGAGRGYGERDVAGRHRPLAARVPAGLRRPRAVGLRHGEAGAAAGGGGARAERGRRPRDRAGVPRRRARLGLLPRSHRGPHVPPAAAAARAAAKAPAARSPRTRGCAGTRRRRRSPACTPRARCRSCRPSATSIPTSRT